MEGKTNFSRRLKQVHGLTWLTLAALHILRQNYVTAPTQWSVSTTRKTIKRSPVVLCHTLKIIETHQQICLAILLMDTRTNSQVKFVISSVEKQRIQFTTRVGVLGQDRSETKKKIGLGLGLARGLRLRCETRSCYVRRHIDLEGHCSNFSSIY